jgi:NitT/TauT family transport system substrate-binding protein
LEIARKRLHTVPALFRYFCLACALLLVPPRALAAEAVTVVLNWVPSAEHAPFFYAAEQGWYRDAGIELIIDAVAGSPQALKRAAGETNTLAVSDFVTYLRTHREHPNTVAVMALQPRSPYALYYSTRFGIREAPDLDGRRIAAQPDDPMRGLWNALARRNGGDAASVRWVALSNPAKPDALAAGEIDAALNPFLHNHLNYEAALGEQMRVMWWHELGFAAYGHVLVAGTGLTQRMPDLVGKLVAVTQRAWARCLAAPQPCLDALLARHPQLDRAHEAALWQLVDHLYTNPDASERTLGAFDESRIRSTAQDADVPVQGVVGLTTNRFLDETIRIPARDR